MRRLLRFVLKSGFPRGPHSTPTGQVLSAHRDRDLHFSPVPRMPRTILSSGASVKGVLRDPEQTLAMCPECWGPSVPRL